MHKSGIAKVFFFVITIFFIDTCSNDDYEFKICPRKCTSTEPWTIDYLEVPSPCYKTKEDCVEHAISLGFTADRCVKCD